MKKLMRCGLLALCLAPGRSLGRMPHVEIYHDWQVECYGTVVSVCESDRIEKGVSGLMVVPGRQINFQVESAIVSIPCSLAQAGVGLLVLLGLGIVGEEWWRRGRKKEGA